MPFRGYSRDQDWLLPPSLGDLIPADHAVRFVAEFIDGLDLAALGIRTEPAREGAPAFHPRVLLSAWVYGFMSGVRASRQIERACRESIPFLWLTGMQQPDHVTLWRFYAANRASIRPLLKQTVQLALGAGLVEFVLQAVDGSKVAIGSVASLCDQAGLDKLLKQVETEISALECADGDPQGTAEEARQRARRLLGKRGRRVRLQKAAAVLQERAAAATSCVRRQAQQRVRAAKQRETASAAAQAPTPEAPPALAEAAAPPLPAVEPFTAVPGEAAAGLQVSTTDPTARSLKGRHGFCVGYNSQVVVDSQAQIVVGADVVDSGNDSNQLAAMLAEAEALCGRRAQAVVADMGYADIADITAASVRGTEVYVPDARELRQEGPSQNPYHKAHFVYDVDTDSYRCPLGKRLLYRGRTCVKGQAGWTYLGQECPGCPAQVSGACTRAQQRSLTRFGYEEALAAHAAKMQSETARQIVRQRKAIVEPVFGLMREQLGLLRFLVRGLDKVKAEWRLLCVAHNLRKLWKWWWRPRVQSALVDSG